MKLCSVSLLTSWINFTDQLQINNPVLSASSWETAKSETLGRSQLLGFFQRRNWATCSDIVTLLLCSFLQVVWCCTPWMLQTVSIFKKQFFSKTFFKPSTVVICSCFHWMVWIASGVILLKSRPARPPFEEDGRTEHVNWSCDPVCHVKKVFPWHFIDMLWYGCVWTFHDSVKTLRWYLRGFSKFRCFHLMFFFYWNISV